jgi:hypothetical protein
MVKYITIHQKNNGKRIIVDTTNGISNQAIHYFVSENKLYVRIDGITLDGAICLGDVAEDITRAKPKANIFK